MTTKKLAPCMKRTTCSISAMQPAIAGPARRENMTTNAATSSTRTTIVIGVSAVTVRSCVYSSARVQLSTQGSRVMYEVYWRESKPGATVRTIKSATHGVSFEERSGKERKSEILRNQKHLPFQHRAAWACDYRLNKLWGVQLRGLFTPVLPAHGPAPSHLQQPTRYTPCNKIIVQHCSSLYIHTSSLHQRYPTLPKHFPTLS